MVINFAMVIYFAIHAVLLIASILYCSQTTLKVAGRRAVE